ncbi:hypothetical protein AB1E19_013574 [Capra hircus]
MGKEREMESGLQRPSAAISHPPQDDVIASFWRLSNPRLHPPTPQPAAGLQAVSPAAPRGPPPRPPRRGLPKIRAGGQARRRPMSALAVSGSRAGSARLALGTRKPPAPHHHPLRRVHAPGAPGSAMARARQEGSSPEPVEGLARDGPRPFPLSRLVPSAVSCGLCEPGLPAAPAAPALLPAAYLCAPTAPPAVTAALGAPRWPGGPRSRPRGPRPDGPQPSLSPAEQHLESPVPSAPGALAGGPTQAAPGVRGEEEQWAREIGAQLRRMADDLNALYERRRQEERQRHRPSPWRVLYNLILGLLPFPGGRGAPEVEPN